MDSHTRMRLDGAMDVHNLDAVIAFSKENVAYGAGYVVPSQQIPIRNRDFAVVATRGGGEVMLVAEPGLGEAKDRSVISDVRSYHEFSENPMAVIAGILAELGAADGRIGVEMDALTANRWIDLQSAMPNVRFRPATDVFNDARMVKGPRELAHLRKATTIATQAQIDALPTLVEGVTEAQYARAIIDRCYELGIERINMAQVASGERTAFANPTPTDRVIKRGELVKVDMFVTEQGYFSDTGRAVAVQESTARQRDAWKRCQDTLNELNAMIKPGVRTHALWEALLVSFARHGWEPDIWFLGHGLGLALHEEPFIAAHMDIELQEGMVLAIEPVHAEDGVLFHIEDNLLVTANGFEQLTPYPAALAVSGL